jgi:hypothetical protein
MPNAKQYAKYKEKMSQNPDLYMKEKERINNIVKNKYATDPIFRNKCINYQRSRRGVPTIDINQDE